MNFIFYKKQPAQLKDLILPQAKANPLSAGQSQTSEKVWKKKNKRNKNSKNRKKLAPPIVKILLWPILSKPIKLKKKQYDNFKKDFAKATYYNYKKKDYFTKNCIKPKNQL